MAEARVQLLDIAARSYVPHEVDVEGRNAAILDGSKAEPWDRCLGADHRGTCLDARGMVRVCEDRMRPPISGSARPAPNTTASISAAFATGSRRSSNCAPAPLWTSGKARRRLMNDQASRDAAADPDRRAEHALDGGRPGGLPGRSAKRHHPPGRVRSERCRSTRRRPLVGRPRDHPDQGRCRPRPDPDEQPVAVAVGSRLLRHRDDLGRDQQARHGPLRLVPVPGQPAPGRRPDRRRHLHDQDGGASHPVVGPDAGAQVVHRAGRLHLLRGSLQAQLLDDRGHRPDHARRHLHPGLPATTGGA